MKPKLSEKNEVITYLEETLKTFNIIRSHLQGRNKTIRMKALMSISTIVGARLDATVKYLKAGGETNLDITMTQGLYNPIIEYLTDEAAK